MYSVFLLQPKSERNHPTMTASKKEQPKRLLPLDSDQICAVLSQPDHIRQAYRGILSSLSVSDTLQMSFGSSAEF